MASISWTSTASGNWSDGSNWSTGIAPGTGDDVTMALNSSITVTYATGSMVLDSLISSGGTLDITGGSFGVSNGYTLGANNGATLLSGGQMRLVAEGGSVIAGLFNQSGGTLTLLNTSVAQSGTFNQSAGIINIATGSFTDSDSGTLAGSITGTGRITLASGNGSITLGHGFTLASSAATFGGLIVFASQAENLTYGNKFTLAQNAAVYLYGNTLTLTGQNAFYGTITNGGTVIATGTGLLNGFVLSNGTLFDLGTSSNTATYNLNGNGIGLGGTGSGTLAIGTGSLLRVTGNTGIAGSNGGTIINNGTIEKVGGNARGGVTEIYGAFSNGAQAVVEADTGIIQFDIPSNGFTSTLAGTFTGAGTILLDSGNFAITAANPLSLAGLAHLDLANSANVSLTTALSYDGNYLQTGGTLVVGSPSVDQPGSFTLAGAVVIDGGLMKGTGTILGTDTSTFTLMGGELDGNLTFDFQGAVNQTGNINFGAEKDAITIATLEAGKTWLLKSNADIAGTNGLIQNYGTFEKFDGAGTSVLQGAFDNFTGASLLVDTGTLALSGQGTLGGTVGGASILDIAGQFFLTPGVTLSVGQIELSSNAQLNLEGTNQAYSYVNHWSQDGATLALATGTLTLTGIASLESGLIQGPGELIAAGPTLLGNGLALGQGAWLQINGTAEQTGNISLTGGSTAPTLAVGSTGTLTMDSGTTIGLANEPLVGTLSIAGTLIAADAGNAGGNLVNANIVDNGSILLKYGVMEFLGSITGTGGINISNGATLELATNTSVTNAIGFGAGGGLLELDNPNEFSGKLLAFNSGDVVEFNGYNFLGNPALTISANGLQGTITEAGQQSLILSFNSKQTASSLLLGEGPNGHLAIIHI
jgi:hypothetical protein